MSNYIYVTDTTSCHIGLELFKNRISWSSSLSSGKSWFFWLGLRKKRICTILTFSAGKAGHILAFKTPLTLFIKKKKKKNSQGLEKAVRWNFHSFQCQLLSWCSVSQNYVVQILPSFLTGALGTDVFNHQSCKSHVTRNCDVKGGRKGNSLMSLNNILQYLLQIWGLFVSIWNRKKIVTL